MIIVTVITVINFSPQKNFPQKSIPTYKFPHGMVCYNSPTPRHSLSSFCNLASWASERHSSRAASLCLYVN